MHKNDSNLPNPTFSPIFCCKAQYTTIFAAFSIRSLNIPQVCLRSLILREHRISRHLGPFATNLGEKVGLIRSDYRPVSGPHTYPLGSSWWKILIQAFVLVRALKDAPTLNCRKFNSFNNYRRILQGARSGKRS